MTDTKWKDKLQGIDKRLWELSQCLTLIQANTLATEVIDIAADLSAIEQEETSKGWISVADRLPERAFQTVLCFCKGGNIKTGQFYGKEECEQSNFRLGRNSRKQYGKHGRWFELAEQGYKVTHWMPLPEPPKENE